MDSKKTHLKFEIADIRNINLYDEQIIDKQLKRYHKLVSWFKEKFDDEELHFFSSPGRAELGGNHTDHNNGRVLTASVDIDSIAVVSPCSSNQVTLFSEGYGEAFCIDLTDLDIKENEKDSTFALIRGVAAGVKRKNYQIGGFNACITSDVLPGSGLSSSASIEVLIGTIFNALYNDGNIPAEEIAKIAQHAENEYFGKPCGLMDQMACAVGGIITIDFKNSIQPEIKKIDFDFAQENYRLIVVNTGGSHADLTHDYAAIPEEMNAVADMFQKKNCREVSESTVQTNINEIRAKLGDRALLRAMHFISENERVQKQVCALQENRFSDFLKLISESGNSSFKWLQNIYTPANFKEQGVSIALALTEDFILKIGEGACRVHGGGFAGTILTFLPEKNVDNYTKLMEYVFGERSVKILSIRPFGAIHLNSFI